MLRDMLWLSTLLLLGAATAEETAPAEKLACEEDIIECDFSVKCLSESYFGLSQDPRAHDLSQECQEQVQTLDVLCLREIASNCADISDTECLEDHKTDVSDADCLKIINNMLALSMSYNNGQQGPPGQGQGQGPEDGADVGCAEGGPPSGQGGEGQGPPHRRLLRRFLAGPPGGNQGPPGQGGGQGPPGQQGSGGQQRPGGQGGAPPGGSGCGESGGMEMIFIGLVVLFCSCGALAMMYKFLRWVIRHRNPFKYGILEQEEPSPESPDAVISTSVVVQSDEGEQSIANEAL